MASGTKYQELAQLGPDCPEVQSEKTCGWMGRFRFSESGFLEALHDFL